MTLFSWWPQSDKKNSFMVQCSGTRDTDPSPRARLSPRTPSVQAKLKLKQAEFFLLFEILGAGFFIRGLDRLGLVRAGARVFVAGLDIDECILAQFCEVIA